MKLKIKVRRIDTDIEFPKIIRKGDWIDLRSAENIVLQAPQAGTLKRNTINGVEYSHRDVTFSSALIRLGIAMQLPKGFEAVMLPRSSTFKAYGVILANSQGVIDNSYCGNLDEWRFHAIALREATIVKGDRICQFRIQLSQKATFWQKLKWFLNTGIKIVEVNNLNSCNRGGIGSTGVK